MAIRAVVTAPAKDIGGFTVRRALPSAGLRAVGPFVFLDQMGPVELAAGQGLDVRPHPHIGLSTMTYLYRGEILHRDSLGTVQAITPGAVNWMVAGRGIVHSERTPYHARSGGAALSGLQFWVALPRAQEETEPGFLHLGEEVLPAAMENGVQIRVIAGEYRGQTSPLQFPHPMVCVDIALSSGARAVIPASALERALYISAGSVAIDGVAVQHGQLAALEPKAETEVVADSDARVMLLGGEPLDGPRHLWWNFVSSSRDRIAQAKEDWKSGRFAGVPGETEFIPLPE